MHLRGLQRGDLERLYVLDTLCFPEPFRFTKAAMRSFAGAANALVLLAVEPAGATLTEALLGFCIVHLEPAGAATAGYVVTLDVAPEARGQGVATRLMRAQEAAAAEQGAMSMILHVFYANAAAISLYERLGYRSVGVAEDFYGAGLQALLYQRTLQEQAVDSQPAVNLHGGKESAS